MSRCTAGTDTPVADQHEEQCLDTSLCAGLRPVGSLHRYPYRRRMILPCTVHCMALRLPRGTPMATEAWLTRRLQRAASEPSSGTTMFSRRAHMSRCSPAEGADVAACMSPSSGLQPSACSSCQRPARAHAFRCTDETETQWWPRRWPDPLYRPPTLPTAFSRMCCSSPSFLPWGASERGGMFICWSQPCWLPEHSWSSCTTKHVWQPAAAR